MIMSLIWNYQKYRLKHAWIARERTYRAVGEGESI